MAVWRGGSRWRTLALLVAALTGLSALWVGALDSRVEAAGASPGRPLLASFVQHPAAELLGEDELRAVEAVELETREQLAASAARARALLGRDRIAELIADLAHDDVSWNAQAAMTRLRGQPEAREALEKALLSPDRQQRQLAASLLREFDDEPSDRLLAVTLEGLRHDRFPLDPETGQFTPMVENATNGTRFLEKHAQRIWTDLTIGQESPDGQQRLLCAYLLARSRCPHTLPRTCQILVGHLFDNDVNGDAKISVDALRGLGRAGLPYLRAAIPSADDQARGFLRQLVSELTDAPDQPPTESWVQVSWGDRLSKDAPLPYR